MFNWLLIYSVHASYYNQMCPMNTPRESNKFSKKKTTTKNIPQMAAVGIVFRVFGEVQGVIDDVGMSI